MTTLLYVIPAVLFTALTVYYYITCERYPTQSLQNKCIVITGGSSGIGLATARHLLKQYRCSICIIGRDTTRLQAAYNELTSNTVNAHNSKVNHVQGDIGNYDSIDNAIKQCIQFFNQPIDVLICCAGQTYPCMFADIPVKHIDSQIQCNLLGTMYTCKSALPSLTQSANKQSPSRILIVSSLSGLYGVAGYAAYSASKFGLRGYAEALHMETQASNVLVSVCLPPDVDTPTYTAEQLIKPEQCKLISEGTGVFQPEVVADAMINCLQKYKFMFSVGFDGWIVNELAVGFGPHTSVLHAYMQLFGLGILRTISMVYRYMHNQICVQVAAKHKRPTLS